MGVNRKRVTAGLVVAAAAALVLAGYTHGLAIGPARAAVAVAVCLAVAAGLAVLYVNMGSRS